MILIELSRLLISESNCYKIDVYFITLKRDMIIFLNGQAVSKLWKSVFVVEVLFCFQLEKNLDKNITKCCSKISIFKVL